MAKDKEVTVRVDECKHLRRRWGDTTEDPFPQDLVQSMNAFVLDGIGAVGKLAWKTKTLHYQFAPHTTKKTYIRMGQIWL